MIGSLHGVVELFDAGSVIILVQGVGYRVHVPQSVVTAYHIDSPIHVYTYTHVREDVLDLYGFPHLEDLKLFEMFLSVSGIGPKTALGIFSVGSRSDILSALQHADVKFFTSVPRLGTKNAQKLIIELKGKVGSLSELDLSGKKQTTTDEVTQALKSFGFKDTEIQEAIDAVADITDPSKKIKMALKYLGK